MSRRPPFVKPEMSNALLGLVHDLQLPPIATPKDIHRACESARILRTIILKELARTNEYIAEGAVPTDIREEEEEGETEVITAQAALREACREDTSGLLSRKQYLHLGALRVVEQIAMPTLLRNATLRETVLPQYMKLITAMTMPCPKGSNEYAKQCDVLQSIRRSLTTEPFFSLLVNCIAPIAGRRLHGPLPKEDAAIIEVALSLFNNLLKTTVKDAEAVVDVMCRTHCVELLLVILHQNVAKTEEMLRAQQEAAALAASTAAAMPEGDTVYAQEAALAVPVETGIQQAQDESGVIHDPVSSENPPPPPLAPPDVSSQAAQPTSDPTQSISVAVPPERSGTELTDSRLLTCETQLVIVSNAPLPEIPPTGILQNQPTQEGTLEKQPIHEGVLQQQPTQGALQQQTSQGDALQHQPTQEGALEKKPTQEDIPQPQPTKVGAVEQQPTQEIALQPTLISAVEGPVDATPIVRGDEANAEEALPDGAPIDNPEDAAESTASKSSDESESQESEEKEIGLEEDESDGEEEDDDDDAELLVTEDALKKDHVLAELVNARAARKVGESLEQLKRWNFLILEATTLVFRSAKATDMAVLAKADPTAIRESMSAKLLDARRELAEWRQKAQRREGATTTTSLLVRKLKSENRAPDTDTEEQRKIAFRVSAASSDNTLLPAKELDSRKRGRFYKCMLQPQKPPTTLPIGTQMLLAAQFQNFLETGFDALSTMVWPELKKSIDTLEQNVREGKESKPVGPHEGPAISDLDAVQLGDVLNYMYLAAILLGYTRATLRIIVGSAKDRGECDPANPLNTENSLRQAQEQWRNMACLMSLQQFEGAFSLLESFLHSRQVYKTYDIVFVTDFLFELFLMLVHLMDGDVSADPTVRMAANALGTTVLYNERHIACVFTLLGTVGITGCSMRKAESYIGLLYGVMSVLDRIAFNGTFALPKRKRVRREEGDAVDAEPPRPRRRSHSTEATSAEAADAREEALPGQSEALAGQAVSDADAVLKDIAEMDVTSKGDGDAEAPHRQAEDGGECAEPQVDEQHHAVEGLTATTNTTESVTTRSREGSTTRSETSTSRPTSAERASAERPLVDFSEELSQTTPSTETSEREVQVRDYFLRLATPKYIQLFLVALRTWRLNTADTNHALVYFLNTLRLPFRCHMVLFNIQFLSVMSDILKNGKETHRPLYDCCDAIVQDFFAKDGFVTALRCTRSLFVLSAIDYRILEEEHDSYDARSVDGLASEEHQGEDEDDGMDEDGADALSFGEHGGDEEPRELGRDVEQTDLPMDTRGENSGFVEQDAPRMQTRQQDGAREVTAQQDEQDVLEAVAKQESRHRRHRRHRSKERTKRKRDTSGAEEKEQPVNQIDEAAAREPEETLLPEEPSTSGDLPLASSTALGSTAEALVDSTRQRRPLLFDE